MKRITAFARRYPLLGPLLWLASLQYLIVQPFVAAAWPVSYSWKNHFISDLGNTVCGTYSGLYVCSPLHSVMNLSFVVFGITIATGSVLLYAQFQRTKLSLFGFFLMFLAGLGTILVGLFPENTVASLHVFGAILGLGVGNIAIVVIGLALKTIHPLLRYYSIATGIICLLAFALFASDYYLGLGRGGIERVASYPFAVWMAVFGAYHLRRN